MRRLLALTGCGTVMNLPGPQPLGGDPRWPREPKRTTIYGGVANDVRILKLGLTSDAATGTLRAPLALLDMPFSALADTLTLPLTIAVTLNRMSNSEPPPDPEAAKRAREFWFNEQPGGTTPPAGNPEK